MRPDSYAPNNLNARQRRQSMLRRGRDLLQSLARTLCRRRGMGTISTAIPSAEYQPLFEAVLAAQDVCTRLPPTEEHPGVGGFALVVLSRWAANAQAFILLRN